jgi:site-specific recombinase
MPLLKKYIHIVQFVKEIRAFSGIDDPEFNQKIQELVLRKSVNEEFKAEITEFCYFTLDNAFFVNAFADYGILSDRGFFPEIYIRFKHKILPANSDKDELHHFLNFLFSKPNDHQWLERINYSSWEMITKLIDTNQLAFHSEKLTHQIHNAIIILCHRLTSIGIDPYLVNKLPKFDDSDSPFFELNHQVSIFVKKHVADQVLDIDPNELSSVLNSIDRAESLFDEIQNKKDEIGTSLHLTFLLIRARQHIGRIRLLLDLFTTTAESNKVLTVSHLIKDLVKAEKTKNSIRGLIKENTNLLAYRIVSHTSEKGENYIGFSKAENQKLFGSAMGGGLLVVFLVFIKHYIHALELSLFFEGILFGLNYGVGFVLMHLMHLTLATKQPSMTASYIAESIDNASDSSKKPWLMFKQIIRSQLVSLIGNLVVVLPLCFLVAWGLNQYMDYAVFDSANAEKQLYSNHPLFSASLIYACITGVFLSLSGIVIGYIDNKVVYSEIAERIMKHPQMKNYDEAKRMKIAAFTQRNLGGILGNLFLGFCLGMAGNIGKFIGIPFDIRHITISAGNFGISMGSGQSFELDLVITIFVGVILIGLINIASSFLISFVVACRSRSLSLKQSLKILFGIY